MSKHNKNLLLSLDNENNTPLLPSNSKGENNFFKIEQRVTLKKVKDINGMQITYNVIKKKTKSLFNVNNNKSASSCNPCMAACKKVNKKINGRKLSKVNNKELNEILRISFPLN
tara:strand:- start:183 stop:524 length:342 start_codon:yes stop_codon:yes gene_type:complete